MTYTPENKVKKYMLDEIYYDITLFQFDSDQDKNKIIKERLKFDYHLDLNMNLNDKFIKKYHHLQKVHERLEKLSDFKNNECSFNEVIKKQFELSNEDDDEYDYSILIKYHQKDIKMGLQIHAHNILYLLGFKDLFDSSEISIDHLDIKLANVKKYIENIKNLDNIFPFKFDDSSIFNWVNSLLYSLWGIHVNYDSLLSIKGFSVWDEIKTSNGIKYVPASHKPRKETYTMTLNDEYNKMVKKHSKK